LETPEKKPHDIDAQLQAHSRRLLAEMERLIGRAKILLLERKAAPTATLGDVLYADRSRERILESDWAALVRAAAAGDMLALHGLYQRAHGAVFILMLRLTGERETAEQLTLDVFHDVWRRSPAYDARNGTVLAWIMNLARGKILGQRRGRGVDGRVSEPLPKSHWERLARRIAAETGREPVLPAEPGWSEPAWEEVAPGISVKMLATDADTHTVSMLVRLVPGGEYPAHTHASVEELHLLDGELWIDDRKLFPGDYNRAEPGTGDKRVWSETGCACVLVTSTLDRLG
jgi:DNA-directed RNA polymerase specialized sigma24 family protein